MNTLGSVVIKDVTAYVSGTNVFPLPYEEKSKRVCYSVLIDLWKGDYPFYSKVLSHIIKGRIDLIYLKNGEEQIASIREHRLGPLLEILLMTDRWNWADFDGVINQDEKKWLEQIIPIMKIVFWAEKFNVPLVNV